MIMRSEKVPESPSSALQTMYFCAAGVDITVFHLMPVGKPAPPRPRKPESVTAWTMAAGVISSAFFRPFRPPCASYSSSDSGSVMPQRAKVSRCCLAK